jgi:hypothetical protein
MGRYEFLEYAANHSNYHIPNLNGELNFLNIKIQKMPVYNFLKMI